MLTKRSRLFLAALAASALAGAFPPAVQARADGGTQLVNVELRTLAGGRERFLSPKAKANVFVFFRTNQERSLEALKQMAACERELAGKSVHWVAIVSDSESPEDVRAVVAEAGIAMPVLVDEGDKLYDQLGVRLHPMVGVADAKLVLAALEPYRQIDYCAVVKTRIRLLLGEADVAELDKVMNPDRSPLPGADPARKAMRDVNMARRMLAIGQYAEAVKAARKALETAPLPAAYSLLGQAQVKLGQCAEATRALDEAIRLDPADAAAQAARTACVGPSASAQ